MWKELLTGTAAQWIFGISGTAILIAIAYYVVGKLKEDINTEIPSQEENLVEFDRMRNDGYIENDEFQNVKKTLAPQIVQKSKESKESEPTDSRKNPKDKDDDIGMAYIPG